MERLVTPHFRRKELDGPRATPTALVGAEVFSPPGRLDGLSDEDVTQRGEEENAADSPEVRRREVRSSIREC